MGEAQDTVGQQPKGEHAQKDITRESDRPTGENTTENRARA
jgi:hypothetical protein